MTTFEGPPVDGVDGVGALTLGGFLGEVVARFGPNEAIVLDDPMRAGETVRWTYERLGAEARRIGRALLAAGVARGDAVGVVMGNRPEAVAAIFGAALAGAVAAPMSTFSPAPSWPTWSTPAGRRWCSPRPDSWRVGSATTWTPSPRTDLTCGGWRCWVSRRGTS